MIENNKIKTVEDALTLEFESKEDIRKNIRTNILSKIREKKALEKSKAFFYMFERKSSTSCWVLKI